MSEPKMKPNTWAQLSGKNVEPIKSPPIALTNPRQKAQHKEHAGNDQMDGKRPARLQQQVPVVEDVHDECAQDAALWAGRAYFGLKKKIINFINFIDF